MIKNLLKMRLFKGIAMAVLVAFVTSIPAQTGYTQTITPAASQKIYTTAPFNPAVIKGLRVDMANPFKLYFIMADGDKSFSADQRQAEYDKLIRYFMTSLVIPNTDMWVNLSPIEANRIIPDNFSMTGMGRDFLAQDYLLKQLTASLMYPEDDLGKTFWANIYKRAYQEFGTTDIPVDTFNKVWITADRADIYQKKDTAILVKSHLKVLLEKDLLAKAGAASDMAGLQMDGAGRDKKHAVAADVVRKVIIPAIEQEVNEGATFAPVRQAYQAMILATWFKSTLKDNLLTQVYADSSKVNGIAINDPQAKERIYRQYLNSVQEGVFNYIKEEYDEFSQETLPRKYFAGGIEPVNPSLIRPVSDFDAAMLIRGQPLSVATVDLKTPKGQLFSVNASKPNLSTTDDLAQRREEFKRVLSKYDAAQRFTEEKKKAFFNAQEKANDLVVSAVVPAADKARMPGWKKWVVAAAVFVGLALPSLASAMSYSAAGMTDQQALAMQMGSAVVQTESVMDRWSGDANLSSDLDKFELVDAQHPLAGKKLWFGDKNNKRQLVTVEVGSKVQMTKVSELGRGLPDGVRALDGKIVTKLVKPGSAQTPVVELAAETSAPDQVVSIEPAAKKLKVESDSKSPQVGQKIIKTGEAAGTEQPVAIIDGGVNKKPPVNLYELGIRKNELNKNARQADKLKKEKAGIDSQAAGKTNEDGWRQKQRLIEEQAVAYFASLPPVTEETVDLQLKELEKQKNTPDGKPVRFAGGMIFVGLEGKVPWMVIPFNGRFSPSVMGSLGNLGGVSFNFAAGVSGPFGTLGETFSIASAGAKISPLGAIVVGDNLLQTGQAISDQETKGSSVLYFAEGGVGEAIQGLFFDTSVKAYVADNETLLFRQSTKTRFGPGKLMSGVIPRIIDAIPLIGKYLSPYFGGADSHIAGQRLDYILDYGDSEKNFFKDARANGEDGKFKYFVREKKLTADVIAPEDLPYFEQMIKDGFGYWEGIIVPAADVGADGSFANSNAARIAFRTIHRPGDFVAGATRSVISVESFKKNAPNEIAAYSGVGPNGEEIVAYLRNASGKIVQLYTSDNIPVKGPKDAKNPYVGILEFNAKGALLQFWMDHESGDYLITKDGAIKPLPSGLQTEFLPNGQEVTTTTIQKDGKEVKIVVNQVMRAPKSGKLPIGAIMKGNTRRVYFDTPEDIGLFIREAMLSDSRVEYGVNFEKVFAAQGGNYAVLLDPKTGQLSKVTDKDFPFVNAAIIQVADRDTPIEEASQPEEMARKLHDNQVTEVVNPKEHSTWNNVTGFMVGSVVDSVKGLGRSLGISGEHEPLTSENFNERYPLVAKMTPDDVTDLLDRDARPLERFVGLDGVKMKNTKVFRTPDGRILLIGKELTMETSKGLYNQLYDGVTHYLDGRGPKAMKLNQSFQQAARIEAANISLSKDGKYRVKFANGVQKSFSPDTTLLVEAGKVVGEFEYGVGAIEKRNKLLKQEIAALEHGAISVMVQQKDGTFVPKLVTMGQDRVDGGITEAEYIRLMVDNKVATVQLSKNGKTYNETRILNAAQPVKRGLPVQEAKTLDEFFKWNGLAVWPDGSSQWVSFESMSGNQDRLATPYEPADIAPLKFTDSLKHFRGINYTPPNPSGKDRTALSLNETSVQDLEQLKAMGINTIRVFSQITSDEILQKIKDLDFQVVVVFSSRDDRSVPADEKFDIESDGYLKFINEQLPRYPKGTVVELGNEYNYHPEWFKGNINNWYDKVAQATRAIYAANPNVIVSVAHGEVPTVEVMQKYSRAGVRAIGLNIYRDVYPASAMAELMDILLHSPGVNPDTLFYFAEFGFSSIDKDSGINNPQTQAQAYSKLLRDISRISHPNYLGAISFSNRDQPERAGEGLSETGFGIYDAEGNPKPAAKVIQNFYSSHKLPARPTREMLTPGVKSNEPADLTELRQAKEILAFDRHGQTVGRAIKILGRGMELVSNSRLPAFLQKHALVVYKEGKGGEFVSLEQLRSNFALHEKIRLSTSSVEMRDANDNLVARLHLNPNIYGSRIEVIQGENSLIFELRTFDMGDLRHPVERTESYTDGDGFKHVKKTNLLSVNNRDGKPVVVEDVYHSKDGKQALLYSIRELQGEKIYFKDGREWYSVGIGENGDAGVTLRINGQDVENVVGWYAYDQENNSGYHINLREASLNSGYAAVRFSQFKDDRLLLDKTGFIDVGRDLTEEGLVQSLSKANFTYLDSYIYESNPSDNGGQVLRREVALMKPGMTKPCPAWIIKGEDINPQPELVNNIMAVHPAVARAFKKMGITQETMFVKSVVDYINVSKSDPSFRDVDKKLLKVTTYTVLNEIQERKLITVLSENERIVEIIVGFEFDSLTGQQNRAYKLTPDFQIKALCETQKSSYSLAELLPDKLDSAYADLANKYFPDAERSVWDTLIKMGMTPEYKPTIVKETPYLVATNYSGVLDWEKKETLARGLVDKVNQIEGKEKKEPFLFEIAKMVRQARTHNLYYTNIPGKPSYRILALNDSRGRSVAEITPSRSGKTAGDSQISQPNSKPQGDITYNLWGLEGTKIPMVKSSLVGNEVSLSEDKVTAPVGIQPGSITIDGRGDIVYRLLETIYQDKRFPGKDGFEEMKVSSYNVLGDSGTFQVKIDVSPAGLPLMEGYGKIKSQVGGGKLGVAAKGWELVTYDPYSYFQEPLYAINQEEVKLPGQENKVIVDGKVSQVPLGEVYTVEESPVYQGTQVKNGNQWSQQGIRVALEQAPLAPDRYQVNTSVTEEGIVKDKRTEGIWKGYLDDLIRAKWFFAGAAAAVASLFSGGWLVGKKRFKTQKERVNEDIKKVEEVVQRKPTIPRENLPQPSWLSYGFGLDVVNNARTAFEYEVFARLQRGESLESVLSAEFKVYQLWRKFNMKELENMPVTEFHPTIEDLWIMLLINKGCGILRNNFPNVISYLFHKSLEARQLSQGVFSVSERVDFGGFVNKEMQRWGYIIAVQYSAFQGQTSGPAKNLMSTDYYIHHEDINDLFGMAPFVKMYDSLEYSLNGQADLRDKKYRELGKSLQNMAFPLIEKMKDLLLNRFNKNVIRTKAYLKTIPEYKAYVEFFLDFQKTEYINVAPELSFLSRLKMKFFSKESKPKGYKITDGNDKKTEGDDNQPKVKYPLLVKTASDTGTGSSNWFAMRFLRSATQIYRNNFRPLFYTYAFVSTVFVAVLCLKTFLFPASAVSVLGVIAVYAGSLILAKAGHSLLNRFLDRNLNKCYGDPRAPSLGVERPTLSFTEKWYRILFSGAFLTATTAINAYMFFYLLIPGMEMWGGTFQPIGGINLNPLLIFLLTMPALFTYLVNFSITDLLLGFFTYIHGKSKGLGVIKTAKDIKMVQEAGLLDDLIDAKLLPQGIGLDKEHRKEIRTELWDVIASQMRNRNEISDIEMEYIREGELGKFELENVRKRMASYVNSLQMDMPKMPHFDDIRGASFVVPAYGEDLIYAYNDPLFATSLDTLMSTGDTNLNHIVGQYKQHWRNLIESVQSKGIATHDEIQRMERLLTEKGQLGALNQELEMEVRLWASYRGQPFSRTLDGIMNYVRVLRIYASISHPEWSKERINKEVAKKVQVVWAYGLLNQVKNADGSKPDLLQKKKDVFYLLKKYQDELGFDVDLVYDKKDKDGVWYNILARYDGVDGIIDLKVSKFNRDPILTGEGKSGAHTHALEFVNRELMVTLDMNQDFYPEQVMKLPILFQEFDDEKVAIVDYPEVISSDGFSRVGEFNAMADRTFSTAQKRGMEMLGNLFHYGHPSIWRVSSVRNVGGISSITHVNEDIKGGEAMVEKGYKIIFREYIEADKLREVAWPGSEGFTRKLGMGGIQQIQKRQMPRLNKFLKPIEMLAHHYAGPGFYFKEPIVLVTLFSYVITVMVLGVSPFAALPNAALIAAVGVLVLGQAIVFKAYAQKVLEDGFWKGSGRFFLLWLLMTPFFMANIFTAGAGAIAAIMGLAAYVATGRGFSLDHMTLDTILKAYGKSHVFVGFSGVALSLLAVKIWMNATLVASLPFVVTFFCGMIIPFILNRGTLPGKGVSAKTFLRFYTTDIVKGWGLIRETITDGWKRSDWKRYMIEAPIYAVCVGVWLTLTTPVAAVAKSWLMVKKLFNGGKEELDSGLEAINPNDKDQMADFYNSWAIQKVEAERLLEEWKASELERKNRESEVVAADMAQSRQKVDWSLSPEVIREKLREEKDGLEELLRKRREELVRLQELLRSIKEREENSDQWREEYSLTAARVAVMEDDELPRLQQLLSIGALQAIALLKQDINELKVTLRSLNGEQVLLSKQALEKKRGDLDFILEAAGAQYTQQLGWGIEALSELSAEQILAGNFGQLDEKIQRFLAALGPEQKKGLLQHIEQVLREGDSFLTGHIPLDDLTQMIGEIDAAMTLLAKQPVGGIDLNSDRLAINIRMDTDGLPLPVASQDPLLRAIEGLTPVIRSIQPVSRANAPVVLDLIQ